MTDQAEREKPGEYRGSDERRYRWVAEDGRYVRRVTESLEHEVYANSIPFADWPVAKAALDALVESEAGEWVEFETKGGCKYRINPESGEVDFWYTPFPEWRQQTCLGESVTKALFGAGIKHGREVALEGVRELVKAVEGVWTTMPDPQCVRLAAVDWERIVDAAGRVKS